VGISGFMGNNDLFKLHDRFSQMLSSLARNSLLSQAQAIAMFH
jgi:hypothetical protein